MMKKWTKLFLFLPLIGFAVSGVNLESKPVLPEKNHVILRENSPAVNNFLNYWENVFRAKYPGSVCDVTREDFDLLMEQYDPLTDSEKEIVNATKDTHQPEYTIGEVIKTIVNYVYPNKKSSEDNKKKLNQSKTIIIAVVVSIFGMSAISVLYILKKDKVIK